MNPVLPADTTYTAAVRACVHANGANLQLEVPPNVLKPPAVLSNAEERNFVQEILPGLQESEQLAYLWNKASTKGESGCQNVVDIADELLAHVMALEKSVSAQLLERSAYLKQLTALCEQTIDNAKPELDFARKRE